MKRKSLRVRDAVEEEDEPQDVEDGTVLKSVISQRRSSKQQRRSRPGVDAQTLKEPPKTNTNRPLNKYLLFKCTPMPALTRVIQRLPGQKDHFASASSLMDSNTYLDAFIDTELQKRRGGMAETAESHQSAQQPSPDFKSKRDRLYEIPEHLRTKKKEYEEGGIKSSSVMLNSIPEIDLGLDEKLKTLEKTEKAKRDFLNAQKDGKGKKKTEADLLALDDPINRFHEPKDLGLTPGQIMQDLFGFRRVAKSQTLHTIGTSGFDPTADAKDRY